MKSLEMVDYYLMCLEEAKTNMCVTCKEHLEEIKQDLEVLEIIRKKQVDLVFLRKVVVKLDNLEEMLDMYNTVEWQHCLTMEELLKLKQWLEVNENDR